MKLSSVSDLELDDPPADASGGDASGGDASGGSESGGSVQLSDETVEVLGDEMTLSEAVEQLGEMMERPEAFGLVPASRLTELNERIDSVQTENGEIRASLQEILRVMDEAQSISQFSMPDDSSEKP